MDSETKWTLALEKLRRVAAITAAVVIDGETRVYFQGAWLDGAAATGMVKYTFDDLFPENEARD